MEVVVMYPPSGIGHLVSMVELGKLITTHHPNLSIIIILTITPPFPTATATYIHHVSATTPSITFRHLPPLTSSLDDDKSYPSAVTAFNYRRLNILNVRHALQTIAQSATISAFIVDFYYSPSSIVAAELNIPAYYFLTSGAGILACFLYFPAMHRITTQSFKDLKEDLEFPGLPPIPPPDMPKPLQDRESIEYNVFIELCSQIPKAAGIITHTFEALEPRSIKTISGGFCVPEGPTPPLFCVGPLLATENNDAGDPPECLAWLDAQPSGSFVFLCFGSRGVFSAEQLKEIAIGLEKSEQRFLWVVRCPPLAATTETASELTEPNLDLLLPEGFLERTKERGLVVKNWAPQIKVLSHDSVGGFVTHCGWNSVLEAASAGVPMVAWPLYSEQRLNRVFLVEELKLALRLSESESGFVTATELGDRVRELMGSEEGEAVRDRAKAAKEDAKAAKSDGGSSSVAFAQLVESWKRNRVKLNRKGFPV